jgi:hypothetical protein
VVRADISVQYDTARPITTLAILSAPCRPPGRTSICNIPVTCIPFTDLRGR